MKGEETDRRNVEILAARISGETLAEIAKSYGISVSRVRQILRRQVLKANSRISIEMRCKDLRAEILAATAKLAAYEDAERKQSVRNGVPIDQASLSVRSFNALRCAGYRTMEQVCDAHDYELLRIPNFGRKSLNEVKAVCAKYRLQK